MKLHLKKKKEIINHLVQLWRALAGSRCHQSWMFMNNVTWTIFGCDTIIFLYVTIFDIGIFKKLSYILTGLCECRCSSG